MGTPTLVITHQLSIDVSEEDYVNENGFYFHATTAGNVKYCAFDDKDDGQAQTKTFEAQASFKDAEPVFCRKIFSSGTTASGIVVGR